MNTRRTIPIALLAGLLVAGCASTQRDPAPDDTTPVSTVEPGEDLALDEPETTDTTEEVPAEVAIGDTFTWTDGLKAAVVKVRRAPISEVGSGGNRARHDNLVLTVKMTATGKASSELSVTGTLQYGVDGRTAEAVFDSSDYGGAETDAMQEAPGRLGKGRSITGSFGYAVPKGGKTPVVFTFNPGYDYVDATFVGRA